MMKALFKILFLIFMTILFSCEKTGWIVNCDECTTNEPLNAEAEAKLESHNADGVEIKIYEGNIEDNILVGTYRTYGESYKKSLRVNKKYTITAKYYINGVYYIAVDSEILQVTFNETQCTDPCYYVYNKVFDLRLKGRH